MIFTAISRFFSHKRFNRLGSSNGPSLNVLV